ncbi:MAG: alpha/beta hydrolase-fold protein [Bacteroidota bacterium]
MQKQIQKTFIVVISTLLLGLSSVAQNGGIPNIVGTNYSIDSEILEEKRQVQVYLPPSYKETEVKYPVLYILDGQLFFNYAVSLSSKFKQARLTPEFIVVGITTTYPQRFRHFSNGKDKFIEFMNAELVPYMERNFRTNGEKLLFGWEYAGSLGFNILLKNTIDFDGYMLASPFPIWDDIEVLENVSQKNSMLYFSVSPDEYQVHHGTEKLDDWLSSKNISGLDWLYSELLSEEHSSTGYPTLYHGLRSYFKYYPQFQEDSFKKFIKAGGLEYAYDYSKKRASKYGFSSELSSWSKFTIIRAALRANDYGHFQSYANTFVTNEFIGDMKYRTLDIADFYEKNKNPKKAIEIYEALLTFFPDSESLLKRTGNAYMATGNDKEAKKYLKLAKNVSKRNN